ncbi:hypothetical protein Syun_026012 [Stephania yunnanensis]|uniref:Uncharacterized protein n=1 Tax=Stephania yunnanensis TaxID=152371 RepID=A0AAP0HVC1_9MAGN
MTDQPPSSSSHNLTSDSTAMDTPIMTTQYTAVSNPFGSSLTQKWQSRSNKTTISCGSPLFFLSSKGRELMDTSLAQSHAHRRFSMTPTPSTQNLKNGKTKNRWRRDDFSTH